MEETFEITEDLLVENLKIVQDKRYYRFTSDSIILSRFASSKKGDVVADFCAGSGIVGLHYYGLNAHRVKSVTLFELQPELCALAQKSVAINALTDVFTVLSGHLQNADKSLNGTFSLVVCNPPYKKKDSGEQGLSSHVAICRYEREITLEEIVSTAARLLANKGRFCICHKPERLTDLLCLMRKYKIEPYRMKTVSAKDGGKTYLVLVEGIKGCMRQLTIENTAVNGQE